MILLQFQTILLPNKLCYWEKNISKQIEHPYVITVLSSVPHETPHFHNSNLQGF